MAEIFGALLTLGEPLTIHDLSTGGFAIDMPFEFLADTQHTFEFSLPWHRRIRLCAMAVHCERIAVGGHALYRSGFAFLRRHLTDDLTITVLADSARNTLPMRSAALARPPA